jgi:uncharacterized protein involved in outer membrane biogenesis
MSTSKRVGIVVGTVVLSLIVAVVLMAALFDWNSLRGPIARSISARIERPVSIGGLHAVLFSIHPRVRVTGARCAR